MGRMVLEREEMDRKHEESKETVLNEVLEDYKLQTYAFPHEIRVRNESIKKALFILKKEDDFEHLSKTLMKKDEPVRQIDFSNKNLCFIDLISSEKEIRPIFFIGNTKKKKLIVLASQMRRLFD